MTKDEPNQVRTGRALRKASDFRRLVATGKRARRDGITVFALAGDPEALARSGLSVRLVGASAVRRNRLRRRLRHALGEVAPARGWDLVVRADGSAAGRSFQELKADLARAIEAVTTAP